MASKHPSIQGPSAERSSQRPITARGFDVTDLSDEQRAQIANESGEFYEETVLADTRRRRARARQTIERNRGILEALEEVG